MIDYRKKRIFPNSTNGSTDLTSCADRNGLVTGVFVFASLTIVASAQLPAPLLYYPFDEGAGSTTATDASGNGYTGDVFGSVVFGVSGAPGGASPGGAAQFSVGGNGAVQVTGLDVPTLLGKRDGIAGQENLSYTMACWILPDAASLSGDRFFFGQSVQGIHNGLRNNGRPHQAHWANDHYGVTVLNSVDWVHLTFTYDGVANIGTIYLNGVQDGSPTSKDSPNGSGNFVIGARQGDLNGSVGQANFVGLIDDVVVYQQVLTQGEISSLASGTSPVDFDDSDSDGMTDDWEIANLGAGAETDDGSVNPDFGPVGDPDGDTSLNLEEYTRLTDPLDNDTDGDSVWDGYETGTEAWNSATDTGTNPKSADSDGDGLSDGVENPDLPFVDENQTGSDPNFDDTDSDGFSDDVEVIAGTDPGDAMIFPAPTDLPIVDDFESDGLNEVIWLSNLEIPQGGAIVSQEMGHVRISGRGHLYTRDQYDPEALGGLYIKGEWTFVGGDDFLQILTRTDAVPAGQYGETQNGIEFNASQLNDGFDIRVRGTQFTLAGNQQSGDIEFNAGSTYEFIIMDDGAGALGFCIWEQGNRANAAGVSNSIITSTATHNHIAFHNREAGRTSNLEAVEIGVLVDSDSDGMPDFWEEDNGLLVDTDDAADDKDGDELTNLGEFLACTDPNLEDTDGDGLKDGAENNNGNYVDASQTGTDPLDPDSDDDRLADGVEVPGAHVGIDNPGTDPNIADTDSDGTDDRVEIVKGSDPTDPTSLAPSGFPILYYSFEQGAGNVILDQTLNYFDGNVVDELAFVDGAPSGSTPGFGIEFTADANGFLNVPGLDINSMIRNVGGDASGSYTVSCWLKPGAGTAGGTGFIFGQTNQGMHHGLRNSGTLHSAHWGSDWDANTVLDQDVWVHATWTYDGLTDTANIYLDGELDGGPTSQTPTTGGGNLMIGNNNNDLNPATRFKGCLDEIAVWDEILPIETIQALAAGESPIGSPSPNSDYLRITGLAFDPSTGNISITWNSKVGESYSLIYDEDLSGAFLNDVDDDIDSGGETTTQIFNRSTIGGAGALKVFFKVVKN